MTQVNEKDIVKITESAIRRLISVEHFRAASIVAMPVLYPSGASVVLDVSMQGSYVFVSDRGGGFQEAEFVGATRYYQREAERAAMEFGIRFDGRDMFVAEVPIDRLDGAMVAVASASAHATATSAQRAVDRHDILAKERLFEKLTIVFGSDGYKKDEHIVGASNHKWRVDAVIGEYRKAVIFNVVTKNYTSATGTAAKFYDIARLEVPPKRIAVVSSLDSIGDWFGVVSGASSAVLELSAETEQYRRISLAA